MFTITPAATDYVSYQFVVHSGTVNAVEIDTNNWEVFAYNGHGNVVFETTNIPTRFVDSVVLKAAAIVASELPLNFHQA